MKMTIGSFKKQLYTLGLLSGIQFSEEAVIEETEWAEIFDMVEQVKWNVDVI